MGGMRTEVRIDAKRLWGGGIAASAIAALAGAVVFLFATKVFDVRLRIHTPGSGYQPLTVWRVLIIAFLAGVAATGVLHLFLRFVPKPRSFFGWLAVLAMVASLLAPLSLQITQTAKFWLMGMHVVVGLLLIILLEATASRVMMEGPRIIDEPGTGGAAAF